MNGSAKNFLGLLIVLNISCNQYNPNFIGKSTSANTPDNLQISREKSLSDSIVRHPEVKQYIYFTIDDGPTTFSNDILQMAQLKHSKFTVFLVGKHLFSQNMIQNVKDYKNDTLIELGNHSYSHASGRYNHFYRNPDAVLRDFNKNTYELKLQNNIVRLPGRRFWYLGSRSLVSKESGVSAAKLLHQAGYNIFGWDVEWSYDQRTGVPTSTAEKIFSEIRYALKHGKTFTPNHCVLLMHERHFIKKDEVSRLIDLCRKEGYKLEHLNHYPDNQSLEN